MTPDPLADLLGLGRAYRSWALTNPHLFGVIFGGALGGFVPSENQLNEANLTMQPLNRAVERGLRAELLVGPAEAIAFGCWAGVHGYVTLVLAGPCEEPGDKAFDAILAATIRGWAAPQGRQRIG